MKLIINTTTMSHISECYYKSKIEKTEREGNKTIHVCAYELKDGGYVVFKDVMEKSEDEYAMPKKMESMAMASSEMPAEMVAEEKSQNLKRLAELAKKLI
jgi:hypothetical protein